MDKEAEHSSGDSAVDVRDVTPLALTSLSPRTPRSPESSARSGTEAVAEPENDLPQHGFVKKRVNDVSRFCFSLFMSCLNM